MEPLVTLTHNYSEQLLTVPLRTVDIVVIIGSYDMSARRKSVRNFFCLAIKHLRATYLESAFPISYSDMRFTSKTHGHLVSFPRKCKQKNHCYVYGEFLETVEIGEPSTIRVCW
ncbi:hypothetical protein Y032_0049g1777 [Ancylostoma ceylanicum]|uniref:Uncharacterized protein n=1 Tax=Ancylostoma ceylanicum TaxID=53326 RepID=A0A016U8Z9_9BILA|nr:hypothetical protein Y032_0049g1777 [Ancylostoma ceylanicum]